MVKVKIKSDKSEPSATPTSAGAKFTDSCFTVVRQLLDRRF